MPVFATQTTNLQSLFSSGKYSIPPYQRSYSWRENNEVADLWWDLSNADRSDPYFLGIIIITATADDGFHVVDGQQRLITLSLFANALRLAAIERKNKLVEQTMEQAILFRSDFSTNEIVPRLSLYTQGDKECFDFVLKATSIDQIKANENGERIAKVQNYLYRKLIDDLDRGPANGLNRWATFVVEKLYISAFVNDSTVSAYKVFEVVNARGKSLTPAEMLKAYVIGSVSENKRDKTLERWEALEQLFRERDQLGQLTQFIRHTLTLKHGLIIPRNLYQEITRRYPADDVLKLIKFLEENVLRYLVFLEPAWSYRTETDPFARSAALLETLGLTTVRPAFLALDQTNSEKEKFEEVFRIIILRLVTGGLGTGAVEARFARFANFLNTHSDPGSFNKAFDQFLMDLKPDREEFRKSIETRNLNNGVKSVLRHSVVFKEVLPPLEGYIHLVHRNKSADWRGFDEESFDALSKTIGNSVLLNVDRRPWGTTEQANVNQLATSLFDDGMGHEEIIEKHQLASWTPVQVKEENEKISSILCSIWYGQ